MFLIVYENMNRFISHSCTPVYVYIITALWRPCYVKV